MLSSVGVLFVETPANSCLPPLLNNASIKSTCAIELGVPQPNICAKFFNSVSGTL